MKTICLYFEVHQPLKLRKYRFFNMGRDVNYLDDHLNRAVVVKNAMRCYKPMNQLISRLIEKYDGKFKVSFSMTGSMIELLKYYAPDVLESFKVLAASENVEFFAETYSHSLVSLVDDGAFRRDVERQSRLIEKEFGVTPRTFRNTELIYSDHIGEVVADMGYTAMVTEGAKHILGWRSPGYLYTNAENPGLRLLLRNSGLSDDIRFRFSDRSWSEWPLTAKKYIDRIEEDEHVGDIVNIFLDYETFGAYQPCESGIFDFVKYLPEEAFKRSDIRFGTPQTVIEEYQPKAVLHVPYPISWTDEERDTTAWLGNELQEEAVSKLYALRDKVEALNDPGLNHVWDFLQSANHFYYMNTKWFTSMVGKESPYDSPYDAFINYMNVLSDFSRDVNNRYAKLMQKQTPKATAPAFA